MSTEYALDTIFGPATVYVVSYEHLHLRAQGLVVNGVAYDVTLDVRRAPSGQWVIPDVFALQAIRSSAPYHYGVTPSARNKLAAQLFGDLQLWTLSHPDVFEAMEIEQEIARTEAYLIELQTRLQALRSSQPSKV